MKPLNALYHLTRPVSFDTSLPDIGEVYSVVMDACMKEQHSMKLFKKLMLTFEHAQGTKFDINMMFQYVHDARGPKSNRSMEPEDYADEVMELVVEAYSEAGLNTEY